jgi:hypothetical protein
LKRLSTLFSCLCCCVQQVMDSLGPGIQMKLEGFVASSDAKADNVFEMMDSDHDGLVGFDDFKQFCQSLPGQVGPATFVHTY